MARVKKRIFAGAVCQQIVYNVSDRAAEPTKAKPKKPRFESAEERAEELLLMGLRLVSGIDKAAFEKNCGIRLDDFVNRRHLTDLAAGGWLEDSSLFLRATAKGFPVLNFLIEQLVSR